jgi:hypothetical protein
MATDTTNIISGTIKNAAGTALASATVTATRLQSSGVAASLVDASQYTAPVFTATTSASGVYSIAITHALAPTCPLTYRVDLPDKRYYLVDIGVNDANRTFNAGTLLCESTPVSPPSSINITNLVAKNMREGSVAIGTSPIATVVGEVIPSGNLRTLILTLTAVPVTLVLNGTSTAGGGTKIWDFEEGLILPLGGSSNLTVANALNKSFLASVGTVAADTGGTLATTEANFLPSTASTTSAGVGTCLMKSTVTVPTPGAPLDGTATAIDMYLNACLNADGTGATALTYSGTITYMYAHLGDN